MHSSTLFAAVLVMVSLTSCSAAPTTMPSSPEDAAAPEAPIEPAGTDVVALDALAAAGTCVFSPEELTSAYAAWSNYVAGPGIPDLSDSSVACEYAHADPALQYVAAPFTIWVEAYSYADPDLAFRAGYENVPAEGALTRAAIADHYCPPEGGQPDEVAWQITCEEGPDATIIVFNDFWVRVVRDDLIWDISASGATSEVETAELESILQIARLAATRSI